MGAKITNIIDQLKQNKLTILVFTMAIILFRYLAMEIYTSIDLTDLYYHRSVGGKMVYLVNNASIGLVLTLLLVAFSKVYLDWKVIIKTTILSVTTFLMVLSWGLDNTWYFNWFILLATMILIQMIYLLDFKFTDPLLWSIWIVIGICSIIMAYGVMFILGGFHFIAPDIYHLIFPNFGDGIALGYALFSGLLSSYILIRLYSLTPISGKTENHPTNEVNQRSIHNRDIWKYVKEIFNFQFVIVVFTVSAAVWMASVFIFDEPIEQEVSGHTLWLTYLLTIPYSIFYSLKRE